MLNKIIVAILIALSTGHTAIAHEGHIEHTLFGWMHSHIGWEQLITMLLIGVLVLLARKR